jgi:predicted enzyme related to lactoylglutathione lyase
MISGTHFLIYTRDPEADRAFFRDVLQLSAVDAGGGWLIFALPPSELALHPGDGDFVQRHGAHDVAGTILYLMCDDLTATTKKLAQKRVKCTTPGRAPWGRHCLVRLPSGAYIGLYQPTHPTAIRSGRRRRRAKR